MGFLNRLFHKHLSIKCLGCGNIIDCNFKRPAGEPEFRFISCPSCTLINAAQHDLPTRFDLMELSALVEEIWDIQSKENDIHQRFLTKSECAQIVRAILKRKGGVWWEFYEDK